MSIGTALTGIDRQGKRPLAWNSEPMKELDPRKAGIVAIFASLLTPS